jgi:NAD(P)-dependent dehydrogenase (short-subunit alcohol dehydrogenase family)
MDSYAVYPSLKDRVVLVTGGATGIGESIVSQFCRQGSKVAFVDINVAAGEGLSARLAGDTGNAPLFLQCSVTDIDALRGAIQEVQRKLGTIRVLVNNAANDDRHSIDSVTPEYWDERMAVNLRHQFFAAQAVIPGMQQAGGGSIINFGSLSWKVGMGGMPAYVTAKAAVGGLTRGLARDVGKSNIRVNTVVPGWVMTERQIRLWLDAEGERTMDRMQSLAGRLMPDDLARMVLFLAADDSRMCSAQEFIVDAGWA